jgi:hypothetical protein
MWFYNAILILGLNVIFSENPKIDCGYIQEIGGCYKNGVIIIGYKNPDETLYHELGHALFFHNNEVKNVIKKYPQPNPYNREIYGTEEEILNENVADYLVLYRYNPNSLKEFYPEIYNLFENNLKQYVDI